MDQVGLLKAARAGDAGAFQQLCAPLRRPLVLHCYQILGSLSEADDMAQDAMLGAWQGLAAFEGRASFRNWLYKIATNKCLNHLAGKRPRVIDGASQASDPAAPLPAPLEASHWLEPAPDALTEGPESPEARYTRLESISLAFMAALQLLPAKQRAVLVLRDVLGWSAQEVAELLDLGVPAVNSALQRARETLEGDYERPMRKLRRPTDEERQSLLRRYLEAWLKGDLSALVALLRVDAMLTMPPFPTRFVGSDAVRFLEVGLWREPRPEYQLQGIRANGEEAAAVWERRGDGPFVAAGIHVLTFDGDRVARVVAFLEGRHHAGLGLPLTLPAVKEA